MNATSPLSTTLPPSPAFHTLLPSGIATLSHWGVLRVQGEDAAKFLHGQMSQDFALLGTDCARLAAYCSPKGRMLASFVGLKYQDHDYLLLCSRDVLAATQKRLSMFVLRAQARLSDATADFQVLGLAGTSTLTSPGSDAPWTMHSRDAARVVQLYPADGVGHQLWVAPSATAAPGASTMDLAVWQWGEVRSGVPMVTAALADALVPQMLNYESVGGVNFKKGCYPGQEVVARSQFRGTLKRRGYRVHGAQPMASAAEVFLADDPEQPAGVVVQSAPNPAGGWDAVVSLQIQAAASGQALQVRNPPSTLEILPLPYPLLEDI